MLGISPKTLYHWVQTRRLVAPTTVGRGRGKSNYFDIDDMANLYLIKTLTGYGFELGTISDWIDNDMLNGAIFEDGNEVPSLWETYRTDKDKYREEGLFIVMVPSKGGKGVLFSSIGCFEAIERYLWTSLLGSFNPHAPRTKLPSAEKKQPEAIGAIVINLLELIREVERRTGVSV